MQNEEFNSLDQIFKVNYKKTIKYDRRIANEDFEGYAKIADQFKEILTDKNDYDLIAPTGSGKTYAVIHFSKMFDQKMILFSPYIINMDQIKEEYKKYNIYSKDDVIKRKNNYSVMHRIVSTYNGIKVLRKYSELNLSEYVMIIDEYHNLFTQLNYRDEPIQDMHFARKEFKKVITITGTSEGIYRRENKNLIRFYPIVPEPKQKITTIITGSKFEEKLINHILEAKYTHKIIIFYNNRKKLDSIKEKLSKANFDNEKIKIISKDYKKSSVYSDIVKEGAIPDDVKILLCTSALSDGINIKNEDISAIYFCALKNLITLRQFYKRFRKYKGPIYDILTQVSEIKVESPWPEFYENINNNILTLDYVREAIDQSINVISDKNRIDKHFIHEFLKEFDGYRFIHYNIERKKIETNIYRVLEDRLNHFFKITFKNVQKRQEYLNNYEPLEYLPFLDLSEGNTDLLSLKMQQPNLLNKIKQLLAEDSDLLSQASVLEEYDEEKLNSVLNSKLQKSLKDNDQIFQSQQIRNTFGQLIQRFIDSDWPPKLTPHINELTPAKKKKTKNKFRFYKIVKMQNFGLKTDKYFKSEIERITYNGIRSFIDGNSVQFEFQLNERMMSHILKSNPNNSEIQKLKVKDLELTLKSVYKKTRYEKGTPKNKTRPYIYSLLSSKEILEDANLESLIFHVDEYYKVIDTIYRALMLANKSYLIDPE